MFLHEHGYNYFNEGQLTWVEVYRLLDANKMRKEIIEEKAAEKRKGQGARPKRNYFKVKRKKRK